jgi:hypothetical protein
MFTSFLEIYIHLHNDQFGDSQGWERAKAGVDTVYLVPECFLMKLFSVPKDIITIIPNYSIRRNNPNLKTGNRAIYVASLLTMCECT